MGSISRRSEFANSCASLNTRYRWASRTSSSGNHAGYPEGCWWSKSRPVNRPAVPPMCRIAIPSPGAKLLTGNPKWPVFLALASFAYVTLLTVLTLAPRISPGGWLPDVYVDQLENYEAHAEKADEATLFMVELARSMRDREKSGTSVANQMRKYVRTALLLVLVQLVFWILALTV
jgi:hypothetical protein